MCSSSYKFRTLVAPGQYSAVDHSRDSAQNLFGDETLFATLLETPLKNPLETFLDFYATQDGREKVEILQVCYEMLGAKEERPNALQKLLATADQPVKTALLMEHIPELIGREKRMGTPSTSAADGPRRAPGILESAPSAAPGP